MNQCLELLGPGGSMFEGSVAVGKVAYSYNVMYNALTRLSKGYSAGELAELFHDTAARVYRIEV